MRALSPVPIFLRKVSERAQSEEKRKGQIHEGKEAISIHDGTCNGPYSVFAPLYE